LGIPNRFKLNSSRFNAAKYGALSLPGRRVNVDTSVAADGRLYFHWSEADGPADAEPATRRGFGMHVIERFVSLNGEVRLDWRPEGLACEIVLGTWTAAG
jgi:two-component sensor histidine kinase